MAEKCGDKLGITDLEGKGPGTAGLSETHCLYHLYNSGQTLTNSCCLGFLFIILLFFLFISLALFLQEKDNIINLIWLQSRHAPLPPRLYDYAWMSSDNFSPRVEPTLVSLSEGNRIAVFLWRERKKPQLCKVLKVLLYKTRSQNWILLLAEDENTVTRKWSIFCVKNVPHSLSPFSPSPRSQHWTVS